MATKAMTVSKWYYPMQVPSSFSDERRLLGFIKSISGMWQASLPGAIKPQIVFVNPDVCSTGAADIPANKILINSHLWSADMSERPNKKATVEDVIGTVVGLQIHETFHFKHTGGSIDQLLKGAGLNVNEPLLPSVFNIVEDTFIDSRVPIELPKLAWTYNYLFSYFFPEDEAQKRFNKLPDAIKTKNDVIDYMNVLPMMRVHGIKMVKKPSPILNELYEEVMTSEDIFNVTNRALHAKRICDILLREIEPDAVNDMTQDLQKALAQATDIKENVDVGDDATVVGGDVLSIGKDEITFIPDGEWYKSIRGETYTTEFPKFNVNAESKKFAPLAALMKARSDTKRFTGEAMNHGSRIRRVQRIATDGKIFADQVVMKGTGPREVGILVDLSGSMEVYFTAALEAAAGAAQGLALGGHSVFVVGHTADIYDPSLGSNIELFMPVFKRLGDSIAVMAKNMVEYASEAVLANNNDDLAVLKAATFFSKLDNSKKLIVISDGAPSSHRIRDRRQGIDQTCAAVESVRAKGIDVISISIASAAFAVNDKIYGQGKNVCNTDPNCIMDLVKAIC